MASYYEVLQLRPDADPETVRTSRLWARQAVTYDPDRERRLEAIDEAYATLSDPDRRQAYDALLAAGTAPRLAGNGIPLVAADRPIEDTHRGCETCGATPAGAFPVVRVTGLVLWFILRISPRARYCRDHGDKLIRAANIHNLTLGWWGPSVLFNWIVIGSNLVSAVRYRRLGPPTLPA